MDEMFFNLLKTSPYTFTKDNIEEIMCDAPRDDNDLLDYKALHNMIRVEFVRYYNDSSISLDNHRKAGII